MLYSKLIDGLIMFREIEKVPKYIDLALEDRVTLKEKTLMSIEKYYYDDEEIM